MTRANYYDDDTLIFYDNYARSSFIRPFRTMYATQVGRDKGSLCRTTSRKMTITAVPSPGSWTFSHETVPVRIEC